MKYTATWTDEKGEQHYEGTFRVLARLRGAVALGRISIEGEKGLISEKGIRLPLEGFESTDPQVSNPQYWGDSIQVNVGEHPYPIVFQVVRMTRYVIEILEDEKELKHHLEDFLYDNKIDFEVDGKPVQTESPEKE